MELFVTLFILFGWFVLPLALGLVIHIARKRRIARRDARILRDDQEMLALPSGAASVRDDRDAQIFQRTTCPVATPRGDVLVVLFRPCGVTTDDAQGVRLVGEDAVARLLSREALGGLRRISEERGVEFDSLTLGREAVVMRWFWREEVVDQDAHAHAALDAEVRRWLALHALEDRCAHASWAEVLWDELRFSGDVAHCERVALMIVRAFQPDDPRVDQAMRQSLRDTFAIWSSTPVTSLLREYGEVLSAWLAPELLLAMLTEQWPLVKADGSAMRWTWMANTGAGLLRRAEGALEAGDGAAIDRAFGALLADMLTQRRASDPQGMLQLIHGLTAQCGAPRVESLLLRALLDVFELPVGERIFEKDSRVRREHLRGVLFGLGFCAGPDTLIALESLVEDARVASWERALLRSQQKALRKRVRNHVVSFDGRSGGLSISGVSEQAGALSISHERGGVSVVE